MNILAPRYTQIPNELLDNLQSFSKAEIAILMILCRLTFGYHKERASVSFAHLARMTGMALSTVIRNTQNMVDRGLITHTIDTHGFSNWSIVVTEEPESKPPKSAEEKTYTPAQESMYEKAVALADVCRMDFKANKGMLLGNAKKLPISVEELKDLFGPGGTWYRLDFRGKKNSPPAVKQIFTEYMRLKQMEVEGSAAPDGPSNSVIKDGEIFA